MAKSKYESHVKPRLKAIKAWSQDGLTKEQISKNLLINRSTFYEYEKIHTDLSNALKDGLLEHIAHVENAQAKIALGYEYEEVKEVFEKTF